MAGGLPLRFCCCNCVCCSRTRVITSSLLCLLLPVSATWGGGMGVTQWEGAMGRLHAAHTSCMVQLGWGAAIHVAREEGYWAAHAQPGKVLDCACCMCCSKEQVWLLMLHAVRGSGGCLHSRGYTSYPEVGQP